MKVLFAVVVVVGVVLGQTLKLEFYDHYAECGTGVESLYYYSFTPGVCYPKITESDSCNKQETCLYQGLDWLNYQSCLLNNQTLVYDSGSFMVEIGYSANYFINYSGENCTGSSSKDKIHDNCDLEYCSPFVMMQQFPRPIVDSSSSDDDGLLLDNGAIIGISFGGVGLICLICLCCLCLIIICLLTVFCVVIIIFIPVYIVTIISYKILTYDYKDHEEGDTTFFGRLLRVLQTRKLDSIQRAGTR